MAIEEYVKLLVAASSLFLAGNVFFLRRLVDKIDDSAQAANRITELRNANKSLEKRLERLESELREIRRLEIDIALLKRHADLIQDMRDE